MQVLARLSLAEVGSEGRSPLFDFIGIVFHKIKDCSSITLHVLQIVHFPESDIFVCRRSRCQCPVALLIYVVLLTRLMRLLLISKRGISFSNRRTPEELWSDLKCVERVEAQNILVLTYN